MSAYTITVSIAPSALLRAQDGADVEATGASFLRALEPVLRREIPELRDAEAELTLSCERSGTAHLTQVLGPDEARARRIEREVRDLIWVVREMVPFAVLG